MVPCTATSAPHTRLQEKNVGKYGCELHWVSSDSFLFVDSWKESYDFTAIVINKNINTSKNFSSGVEVTRVPEHMFV